MKCIVGYLTVPSLHRSRLMHTWSEKGGASTHPGAWNVLGSTCGLVLEGYLGGAWWFFSSVLHQMQNVDLQKGNKYNCKRQNVAWLSQCWVHLYFNKAEMEERSSTKSTYTLIPVWKLNLDLFRIRVWKRLHNGLLLAFPFSSRSHFSLHAQQDSLGPTCTTQITAVFSDL